MTKPFGLPKNDINSITYLISLSIIKELSSKLLVSNWTKAIIER